MASGYYQPRCVGTGPAGNAFDLCYFSVGRGFSLSHSDLLIRPFASGLTPPLLKKLLLLLLCIPLNGWAGSIDSNDTTDLLLGGVGVLLGHELGHLVLSQTKDIEFDGVRSFIRSPF